MKKSFVVLALSLFGAGVAQAEDLNWTLENVSGAVIVEFYTSPVGDENWGEDLTGADVLGSGESADVLIADGATVCDYDLQFVFDDGSTMEDTVDMCSMASYTVSP